jgi:hypothetical protein
MIAILLFIAAVSIVLMGVFRQIGPLSGGKVSEIVIGVLGWFGMNTLLWIWVLSGESGTIIMNPFRLMPLCVNIPVLFVLGLKRRSVLLGIGVAILLNAVGMLVFTAPGPIEDDRFFDLVAMTPFFLTFFYPL